MTATRYPGKSMTIVNYEGRCIHSRNCVLQRPEVFIANATGAWIAPDAANTDATAATILSCPSGALAYERHDGGMAESAPPVNVVRVRENGPLEFHAALDVAAVTGHFRATLCRCGLSGNKPYCDSSHVAAQFQASGEPATQESMPLAVRDGPLKVTPAPNGPGQRRNLLGYRAHGYAYPENRAMPLWCVGQETVLRRESPTNRLQRSLISSPRICAARVERHDSLRSNPE
jgi:uncharacterized Fe-S cluster protein YjdI/CDGSH-type Zn-finger protein